MPKESHVEISTISICRIFIHLLTLPLPFFVVGSQCTLRVSQGFWGTREHWQNIEGNKGTLAIFGEQGNKIRKMTKGNK